MSCHKLLNAWFDWLGWKLERFWSKTELRLKNIVKWISFQNTAEQSFALEQSTESQNTHSTCPGQLTHSDSSPSLIACLPCITCLLVCVLNRVCFLIQMGSLSEVSFMQSLKQLCRWTSSTICVVTLIFLGWIVKVNPFWGIFRRDLKWDDLGRHLNPGIFTFWWHETRLVKLFTLKQMHWNMYRHKDFPSVCTGDLVLSIDWFTHNPGHKGVRRA